MPELNSEVKHSVAEIAPNRFRIDEVRSRVIEVDPMLAAVLREQGGIIGITSASDSGPGVILPPTRKRFETSAQLLAAKKEGIVTGDETWYRTEYMRLKQNERRAGIREEVKAKAEKRQRRKGASAR